eukprot:6508815-Heterocapsa_arctica.AAC.1
MINVSVFPVDPVERAAQASAEVIFNNDLPPIADDIILWAHVPAILKSALQRIHEGHTHAPYKESLVRYLQAGGASARA